MPADPLPQLISIATAPVVVAQTVAQTPEMVTEAGVGGTVANTAASLFSAWFAIPQSRYAERHWMAQKALMLSSDEHKKT